MKETNGIDAKTETLAKIASAYAGFVFGVYWIPLRALDQAGFYGIWATAALNCIPFIIVLPVVIVRWSDLLRSGLRFHIGSIVLGVAYTLYASAFLFTEVINVIVLYYLLPLWGFVLARLFTGEPITPIRWLSMVLGFSGMLAIFGLEHGVPLPNNTGDWMALASGLLWAAGSLMLLTDKKGTAFNYGIGFIFWGTLGAMGMAWLATSIGVLSIPNVAATSNLLPWLIPVAVLVILPGGFAAVFGPTVLNPGVVGLLYMTEISVGTITAAILTDEPFGLRQITGVIVISLAGILETLWQMLIRNRL